ncbi:sodium:calcium antiporter, partial [Rhizobium sp. SIMBA_035]
AYLTFTLQSERRSLTSPAQQVYEAEAKTLTAKEYSLAVALGIAVFGLTITVLGAKSLVAGAVTLAHAAGITETVIGLTIVAIGTSL